MAQISYSDKLKDPRWQRRRLKILERDNWACVSCHIDNETLNVHHLKYHPSGNPWEVEDRHLITLCEDCHKEEHSSRKAYEERLLDALKGKSLTAGGVLCLAKAFDTSELLYPLDFLIENIEYLLRTPDEQSKLDHAHGNYLKEKSPDELRALGKASSKWFNDYEMDQKAKND